ncbi:Magnesium and cobalt efflux protein CorC [Planctomycetales bacterium 10988]|nr:Magnesium and cobalt efflux protein CorC [Planctomycetales bacterium 10988]
MWTIELIVVLMMIAFNSVFAGYEIALASINMGRLQALKAEGHPGAAAALRMKQSIEASLAVVQLGITLVGAVAAATGGAGAEETIEPILNEFGLSGGLSQFLSIALIVAPLTVLTIIFGELVPKVFSLRNKEWVCLKLSPIMEWFSYTVWPAVWFFENSVSWIMKWSDKSRGETEEGEGDTAIEELHGAAALARMSRLIGHRQEGIIVSASRLANTPLRKIMLPAEYIGMLDKDASLSDALVEAHLGMHTRYPVTEEPDNPQRIVGYVNFKDIVSTMRISPETPTLHNLVRKIHHFKIETSVADCLEYLIRERSHIALIEGSDDRILGMITLEDIIEELVGEIHDEFDRMPGYISPVGKGWIAGGFVSLKHLREITGIDLKQTSEKPVYTLNDWIAEHLDHPPRGGDEIVNNHYRILIRKTRHILVQEAYLCEVEKEKSINSNTQEQADGLK